jgi:vancomycin permeability regulator SanA
MMEWAIESTRRFLFQCIAIACILYLICLLSIDQSMVSDYEKSNPSKNYRTVPQATVAIIPGAAVYGLTPSPILSDRLKMWTLPLSIWKSKKNSSIR